MVCNLGQSVLLQNFVCHAMANGLLLPNIIVFATDKETYEIAKGLGLAAFYDEAVREKFISSLASETNF